MKYTSVIFDLDGTLLDTLDDLTDAVNEALTRFGFPTRTRAEVCAFVGNGVARLMARAVPGGTDNPAYEACLAAFKEAYSACCRNKTAPYPGILPLLDGLRAAGVKTAVVSNKFDAAVRSLCAYYFGDRIPAAVGERPDVRRKPAPDAVLEAMRALDADPAHTVYVGDSDVDVLTAHNAGLPCISVTWGFRDAAFLRENGAETLAADTDEVMRLIMG